MRKELLGSALEVISTRQLARLNEAEEEAIDLRLKGKKSD